MADKIDRMTLLIVDDHATFRTYARSMLVAEGYDVIGDVADGESAVEAAERLEPTAVLLDIQLGDGIDGFEVARRLAPLPHPPQVVLASSREASAYGSKLTDAPVRGFVSKEDLSGKALTELLGTV
ncbi:MAG: response regulator [Aeromicrobium sp.]